METERWRVYYERLVLPYVLAYAIATVGMAVGFIYPVIIQGSVVTALAIVLRWVGVVGALLLSSAVVWWFVVEATWDRLVLGGVGIALTTLVEAIGGGYLALQSPLATSMFALVATALTAVSLVLLAASLAVVTRERFAYGRRLLTWHWVLALAVPLALVLADRALPFEPDPVIGLIFVVVPVVALLELANAELVRVWLEHPPRSLRSASHRT